MALVNPIMHAAQTLKFHEEGQSVSHAAHLPKNSNHNAATQVKFTHRVYLPMLGPA